MTNIPMNVSSIDAIKLEEQYGAHNYHPLPVVLSKGDGVYVWDPEGKKYFDFLSAYSAVNQGHCHPKILSALVDQASTLSLSSRAFYNDRLGPYEKFITEYFGYDMVLPMNTGVEAVETAVKLARRWAYVKKNVPMDQAIILTPEGNFHGRTLAAISMSTDPESRTNFGPFVPNLGPRTPGNIKIRYNNADDLELALRECGDRVAAFLVEPIQGEAGVVIPDDGYLTRCAELCKEYNVLFIADEIQSGLGRTGHLLAVHHENLHPDVVLLGKALSGGVYPVSAVLSSKEVMLTIKPGEHGSTYGGNPVACATAIAALSALRDEKMCQNSMEMGKLLRSKLNPNRLPFIKDIRGRGLFSAIEVDPEHCKGRTAWELCLILKDNGLLCKPTHDHIIRLSPPLVINAEQVNECASIINSSLDQFIS